MEKKTGNRAVRNPNSKDALRMRKSRIEKQQPVDLKLKSFLKFHAALLYYREKFIPNWVPGSVWTVTGRSFVIDPTSPDCPDVLKAETKPYNVGSHYNNAREGRSFVRQVEEIKHLGVDMGPRTFKSEVGSGALKRIVGLNMGPRKSLSKPSKVAISSSVTSVDISVMNNTVNALGEGVHCEQVNVLEIRQGIDLEDGQRVGLGLSQRNGLDSGHEFGLGQEQYGSTKGPGHTACKFYHGFDSSAVKTPLEKRKNISKSGLLTDTGMDKLVKPVPVSKHRIYVTKSKSSKYPQPMPVKKKSKVIPSGVVAVTVATSTGLGSKAMDTAATEREAVATIGSMVPQSGIGIMEINAKQSNNIRSTKTTAMEALSLEITASNASFKTHVSSILTTAAGTMVPLPCETIAALSSPSTANEFHDDSSSSAHNDFAVTNSTTVTVGSALTVCELEKFRSIVASANLCAHLKQKYRPNLSLIRGESFGIPSGVAAVALADSTGLGSKAMDTAAMGEIITGMTSDTSVSARSLSRSAGLSKALHAVFRTSSSSNAAVAVGSVVPSSGDSIPSGILKIGVNNSNYVGSIKTASNASACFVTPIALKRNRAPEPQSVMKTVEDCNQTQQVNSTPNNAGGAVTKTTSDSMLLENQSSIKQSIKQKSDHSTLSDTSALINAAYQGKLNLIELLVNDGADINAVNNEGQTALYVAVISRRFEVIKFLVEIGADVNVYTQPKNSFALKIAASEGQLDVVKLLVKGGANVEAASIAGHTALSHAALMGHVSIVEHLAENGADVNTSSTDGTTALMSTAHKGHIKVIKYLVERGADVNAVNNNGETALYFAAYKGRLEVVKFLVEKGADVNTTFKKDGSNAQIVAAMKGRFDVVKYLFDNKADLNAVNNNGETALYFAAYNGHFEIVKFLIENRADLNFHCNHTAKKYIAINGASGLLSAALSGHLEALECNEDYEGHLQTVQFLVEKHHANVDVLDKDSLSAARHSQVLEYLRSRRGSSSNGSYLSHLINASSSSSPNSAHIAQKSNAGQLIQFAEDNNSSGIENAYKLGWDLNEPEENRTNALISATRVGSSGAVLSLIQCNANVDAPDGFGRTALFHAIQVEENDIAEILSENSADVNYENIGGQTPFIYAVQHGNLRIAELLVGKGAKIQHADKKGRSALYYALKNAHGDMIDFLIRNGANINHEDYEGATPLIKVVQEGDYRSACFLVDRGAKIQHKDKMRKTALDYASEFGFDDLKDLLIKKAAVGTTERIRKVKEAKTLKVKAHK